MQKIFALFVLVGLAVSQTPSSTFTLGTVSPGSSFTFNASQTADFFGLQTVDATLDFISILPLTLLTDSGVAPSVSIQNGVSNGGIATGLTVSLFNSSISGQIFSEISTAALNRVQAADPGAVFGSIIIPSADTPIAEFRRAVGVGANITFSPAVFSLTNGEGTGNLIVTIPNNISGLVSGGGSLFSDRVYLVSTQSEISSDVSIALTAPVITTSNGLTSYSYSVAYGRLHAFITVGEGATIGLTETNQINGVVNSTFGIRANNFLAVTSDNEISNDGSYVLFYSTGNNSITLAANTQGQKGANGQTYSAISGLSVFGQTQLSITSGAAYNGNMTIIVPSATVTGSKFNVTAASFYKANTGTTNGSGFTKVNTTVVARGTNYYFTTAINGGFSEWVLAQPGNTTTSSSSSTGSASTIVMGVAALVAGAFLAF